MDRAGGEPRAGAAAGAMGAGAERAAAVGSLARRTVTDDAAQQSVEGISQMAQTDEQHSFVVKQLDAAVRKCERHGIPPEVVVQAILSFGLTMAIAFQDQEDAAKLLESLASAVRRGDITSTEH